MGRLFRRFFRMIERSWQMYPLGDVSLSVLSNTGAVQVSMIVS
jgi:high-affinity nickel permease